MPEEKTQKEKVIDFFQSLQWPEMKFEEHKISCPSGDVAVFDGRNVKVDFHFYNRLQNQYEKRNNRQTLIFSDKINLDNVLRSRRGSDYDIPWFDYIKNILTIGDTFTKIKILTTGKKILRKTIEKTIQIPESILDEMAEDAYDVFKKGRSSRNRLETYLINKLKIKYTGKAPKETTTVSPGDFSFLVERFNLKNKNKKKDYDKFLDVEDIKNLEYFTEKLIKDEVFSPDFLHALDEFFIKEKLQDIIKTGRDILALRSKDVKTGKAKKVITMITDDGSDIKQLENIWQTYFEKYLLYLIFSYKKIYPKIELKDIDGDKKYPDFIGINHYNGLDIIEIKTHLKNAVTWDSSHKNYGFSSELSKAIIQTMNYMDAIVQHRFQNSGDRNRITSFTDEENLFHPRGIIIISSAEKLSKSKLNVQKEKIMKRDFTKLRNSLHNIEILTFSEILQIADDYVKNIHSQYEIEI